MTYDFTLPNAYQLATMADCTSPDSPASAGARLLENVRDQLADLLEEVDIALWDDINDDGSLHDIADNAPDVYTYTRWQEFVDLAAWQEDPSDLGMGLDSDMTSQAGLCLYMIAERLVAALMSSWREDAEDAEALAESADA